jgi:hypothetical protein
MCLIEIAGALLMVPDGWDLFFFDGRLYRRHEDAFRVVEPKARTVGPRQAAAELRRARLGTAAGSSCS